MALLAIVGLVLLVVSSTNMQGQIDDHAGAKQAADVSKHLGSVDETRREEELEAARAAEKAVEERERRAEEERRLQTLLAEVRSKAEESRRMLNEADSSLKALSDEKKKVLESLKKAQEDLESKRREIDDLDRQKREASNSNSNNGGDSKKRVTAPRKVANRKPDYIDMVRREDFPQKSEKELEDLSHNRFAFNQYLSEKTDLHRPIPDTRSEGCSAIQYPKNLPAASVIICFVDETWSVLMRTVHSVLDRTPPELLKEIILMDDGSTAPWLLENLDNYIATKLPSKVKVIRSSERLGLIRARMVGAEHATSEMLIFLDSHCEANVGWMEPLIAWMAEDYRRVVCPVIDMIRYVWGDER